MTVRIAMWSGPRNLSTAMMYSFAARGDTQVVDEPFYAAYLAQTGADHPMRAAVLASQPQDPGAVADHLMAPMDAPIFYQKHMTHHMLPGWPTDWMAGMRHVFLIRHPARVVASYAQKRAAPTLEDLGFAQQAQIFDQVPDPIVVDSSDIRARPAQTLAALCAALDVPWTPAMLHWPAGGHPADGVWAAHWYGAIHGSTGFAGAEPELPVLEPYFDQIVTAALPFYTALAAHKIT